jgi:hypothetical protein
MLPLDDTFTGSQFLSSLLSLLSLQLCIAYCPSSNSSPYFNGPPVSQGR